jgi:hypothetical protein
MDPGAPGIRDLLSLYFVSHHTKYLVFVCVQLPKHRFSEELEYKSRSTRLLGAIVLLTVVVEAHAISDLLLK